jgi:hypothetical protein
MLTQEAPICAVRISLRRGDATQGLAGVFMYPARRFRANRVQDFLTPESGSHTLVFQPALTATLNGFVDDGLLKCI